MTIAIQKTTFSLNLEIQTDVLERAFICVIRINSLKLAASPPLEGRYGYREGEDMDIEKEIGKIWTTAIFKGKSFK